MKLYNLSDTNYALFQPIATAMSLYGITRLSASFDGGGDSGEIYSVDIAPSVWKNEAVQPNVKTDELDQEGSPIIKAFEDLCYSWLDAQDVDWYNNEGGSGQLEITMPLEGEAVIDAQIYQRVVEDITAFDDCHTMTEA